MHHHITYLDPLKICSTPTLGVNNQKYIPYRFSLIASHDSKMLQNVIIFSQCSIKVQCMSLLKKREERRRKCWSCLCDVQVSVAILQIKVG
jgi:hypothetical protein